MFETIPNINSKSLKCANNQVGCCPTLTLMYQNSTLHFRFIYISLVRNNEDSHLSLFVSSLTMYINLHYEE